MYLALAVGLALGFSLAAPPGPMNALIARETVRSGVGAGIRIGLGAPVADVVFLVLVVFGAAPLLGGALLQRLLAAAGMVWMSGLAVAATRPLRETIPGVRPTFLAGFGAALLNPYQLGWWLTAGVTFLRDQGGYGVTGLVLGIFGWVVLWAYLVGHGARRWTGFSAWVQVLSADLLFLFSMVLGWRAVLG